MLLIKELPDKKTIKKLTKDEDDVNISSIITMLTMLKASSDILVAIDKYFTTKDLSHSRFSALSVLNKTEKGLYPNELADELGVSRATASTIISGLEKSELAKTEKAENDGRMKSIKITEKGRALYEELLPEYFSLLSSYTEGLSKKDMKSASEMMQTMIENMAKPK